MAMVCAADTARCHESAATLHVTRKQAGEEGAPAHLDHIWVLHHMPAQLGLLDGRLEELLREAAHHLGRHNLAVVLGTVH